MPVKENNGFQSRVTGHPKRSPYFAVVEIENSAVKSLNIFENPYREENHHEGNHEGHHRGMNQFFKFLMELKPDAIISYTIGPGAFYNFKALGIKMYAPKGHTVKENVDALIAGNLDEMKEPYE